MAIKEYIMEKKVPAIICLMMMILGSISYFMWAPKEMAQNIENKGKTVNPIITDPNTKTAAQDNTDVNIQNVSQTINKKEGVLV